MKNSWLKQATVLGLVFFISIFLVKPIGVSTQFNVVGGMIWSVFDQDLITETPDADYGYTSTNAYFDKEGGKIASSIEHPLNYDFVFVIAIPFGAWIASLIFGKKNRNKKETASLPFSIYVRSFITGFLLLFGARMAGGCTSGHMMSGMMQGSISGYVFAAAVFLVAIPVAMYMTKRRKA